jgi:thiol-disulfide isomerase/thioredoxin
LRYPLPVVAIAFAVLALAGIGGYRALSEASRGGPLETAGEAIWQASLPDLAGAAQPLRQWRGKVLVVNFWAPWCPPCRAEIPDFVRLQHDYGGRGVQFVGIALDREDRVRDFVAAVGVDYPILLGSAVPDLGRAAGNRNGGLPYTLVLDRRGRIAASLSGGIERSRLEAVIRPLL